MPSLYDKPKETVGIPGGRDEAIVLHCEQQGAVWHGARLGIVTASMASNVVTSKGEPCKGKTRAAYLHALIGEQVSRTIEINHYTAAMERGLMLQGPALEWYRFAHRPVEEVGFVYCNEKRDCGCSPDGLCEDRVVEIKCPLRKNMVGYLLAQKVPTEYIVQTQFSLWITGLALLDFCIFTDEPHIPNAVCQVEADAKLHAAFAVYVPAFTAEVRAGVEKIKSIQ